MYGLWCMWESEEEVQGIQRFTDTPGYQSYVEFKKARNRELVARVGSEQDMERLRQDLIELFKWSEDWQMLFNFEKCALMYFGFAITRGLR